MDGRSVKITGRKAGKKIMKINQMEYNATEKLTGFKWRVGSTGS